MKIRELMLNSAACLALATVASGIASAGQGLSRLGASKKFPWGQRQFWHRLGQAWAPILLDRTSPVEASALAAAGSALVVCASSKASVAPWNWS